LYVWADVVLGESKWVREADLKSTELINDKPIDEEFVFTGG
jgi:hypothetical protein